MRSICCKWNLSGGHNSRSVKRVNYHDDKILMACNIWKWACCMKNFVKIETYLLHSDSVCCMQNSVKFCKICMQQTWPPCRHHGIIMTMFRQDHGMAAMFFQPGYPSWWRGVKSVGRGLLRELTEKILQRLFVRVKCWNSRNNNTKCLHLKK